MRNLLDTGMDEGLHSHIPAMYRVKSTISQISESLSIPQPSTKTLSHGHTAIKRSKSTLVFLTEKDLDNDARLMQRKRHEQGKNDKKSPEWFQDRRYHHQQQAEYLKRLAQMRKSLEVESVKENKTTSKDGPTTKFQHSNPFREKVNGFITGPEQYTKRQKKLQVERQKIIERQQKHNHSDLGYIEVRPLTDVGPKSLDKEHTQTRPYDSAKGTNVTIINKHPFFKEKTPRMTAVKLPYLTSPSEAYIERRQNTREFNMITELIELEQRKHRPDNNLPLPSQYSSSIPNIGRKAVRDPGKLILEDTKGKSFYRKDKHGLYRNKNKFKKKKQYLRADADEIDINSFSLDEKYWDFYRESTYGHSIAPCPTPALYTQGTPTVQKGIQGSESERKELNSQFHNHRTHTQELIDMNGSIGDSDDNNNHNHDKSPSHCIFCENPELIPVAIPHSEFEPVPVLQSTFSENSKTKKQKVKSTSTKKTKQIFVDLTQVNNIPELQVESPSPKKSLTFEAFNKDSVSDPHQPKGNLIKTYRQNELRQREVSNLLEDVDEINQLNKTLKDVSGLEAE